MDNSIYEVERNDYAAFIGQLNKQLMDIEDYSYQDCTFLKIRSKKTGKHLCTRIVDHNDDDNEKYFIFNYPDDDERRAPDAIRRITLETREEVQAFFDVLNKIQGKSKDD